MRLGGPRPAIVAGLSLTKLFIGSEGILGVITELTLRLIPAQPPASTEWWRWVEDAANAVVAITGTIRPAMLEFMDHASIKRGGGRSCAHGSEPLGSRHAARAVRTRHAAVVAGGVATMIAECEKCGAEEVFALTIRREGQAFTAARRAVFPAVERSSAACCWKTSWGADPAAARDDHRRRGHRRGLRR